MRMHIELNNNEKLKKELAENVTSLACFNIKYCILPDMPKLKQLFLCKAPLKTLPDMPKLTKLDLYKVPLKTISDMSKLTRLFLYKVPLKTISDMPKLKELYLYQVPLKGLKHIQNYQNSDWDVIKINNILRIGCEVHTIDKWKRFSDNEIARMHPDALDFCRKNKQDLLNL